MYGVKTLGLFFGQVYHFHGADAKSGCLNPPNDLANQPTTYTVGLENSQRLFHNSQQWFSST
jgi:hypothetical protein